MKTKTVSLSVAASYFNVDSSTMYRWATLPEFPRHQKGRNVFVSLQDVGEWLNFVYPTQLKRKKANLPAVIVRKEPDEE